MRRLVKFHYEHYWDQNLSGDPKHILIAAKILQGEFQHYREYKWVCSQYEISPVSEKTWDENFVPET